MRSFLFVVFLSLIFYAIYGFIFGNFPDQEIAKKLISGMFTLQFGEVDLSIICLFMAMGMIPMLFGFYLIPKRHKYNLPLFPFLVASMGLGAFGILPYLFLRRKKDEIPPKNLNFIEKILDNPIVKIGFACITFGLIVFGFVKGSSQAYAVAFRNSQIVNFMTFDFFVMVLIIFPYLIFQEFKE